MTSIFTNTKSKVTVHILHDDTLTDDNRRKFIRTAEKYSQGIDLVNIEKLKASLSKGLVEVSKLWTIGTLYRLFVPDVFSELSKLIYLDCDILVNMDIRELWDIELEGKSLVAVQEVCYAFKAFSSRNIQLRLAGCRRKSYVNAGVLIMNLAKLHEMGNFFGLVSDWILHHSHLPIFVDQDAINSIFLGDIKFIDGKFNVDALTDDISDSIIHTWRSKPWREFLNTPQHLLYWDMFLLSAWGENITPHKMIRTLAKAASLSSQYYHKFPRQCVKQAAKAILRKLSLPGLRLSASMILKYIYHRLTHR